MNRDEFLAGGLDDTTCAPGRRLFVVAINTTDVRQTERSLRSGVFDYFGSLATGVRLLDDRPGTDEVVGS